MEQRFEHLPGQEFSAESSGKPQAERARPRPSLVGGGQTLIESSRPETDCPKCLTMLSEWDDNTVTKAAKGDDTRRELGTVAGIA